MADLTHVSTARLRFAATLVTFVLVFVHIYLAVWSEPEREDADGFVICLEPTFAQFAFQGQWTIKVFLVSLMASLGASMICYVVTWLITEYAEVATVQMVVG